MVRDGFKVLDSDMHVLEPPDLWQRYIDPEFKSQAPVGKTDKIADLQMVGPDGKVWGRTQEVYRDTYQRRGSTDFVKNEDRYRPFEEKGWTPEVQLDGMAQEGIDVAVLYPSRGLFALTVPDLEPRLAAAIARAYNNWLYDFCQKDPSRLLGAGMISPFDVNDAVSETQRCVNELGFKAVFLRPNLVNDRNWYDPYYEPLWDAIEELRVPLGFHEGAGAALPFVGKQFGENGMLRHTFSHPAEQMLAVASFTGGGILERHPNMKVAFLEGNCSWVPFLFWRLDEHWERLGRRARSGTQDGPQRVLQAAVLRFRGTRRGAGQVHHRLHGQQGAGLLHRLPPPRLQVPGSRAKLPDSAHQRRGQADDSLGQLRPILRC